MTQVLASLKRLRLRFYPEFGKSHGILIEEYNAMVAWFNDERTVRIDVSADARSPDTASVMLHVSWNVVLAVSDLTHTTAVFDSVARITTNTSVYL